MMAVSYCGPATPSSPFESPGLGSSDFARHYFRNHGCFLFLWVLRWFTSPGSLHTPMYSAYGNPCSHGLGSPIRISPDQRLLAPPRSFSQLATSFFAYLRQGIPTHALSSLTIKLTPFTQSFFSSSLLPAKRFPAWHSCLDAIASAPLLLPFRIGAGELVASPWNRADPWNAHQIFNCQRARSLLQPRIKVSHSSRF